MSLPKKGVQQKFSRTLYLVWAAAADIYQQDIGSALTKQSHYGNDPFPYENAQHMAENEFCAVFADSSVLNQDFVHNIYGPFQEEEKDLIDVTIRYL